MGKKYFSPLALLLILVTPSVLLYSPNLHETQDTQIILITGFEPFSKYELNPSQLIVEGLNGKTIETFEIIGIVLPVDYNESAKLALEAIETFNPIIVVSFGLSSITSMIELEKVAMNIKKIPKNERKWIPYQFLDPDRPLLYTSSIKTGALAHEVRKAGIPARQSFSAGTYVCNALYFYILDFIYSNALSIIAEFVHVPLLRIQDARGMDIETMLHAAEIIIMNSVNSF